MAEVVNGNVQNMTRDCGLWSFRKQQLVDFDNSKTSGNYNRTPVILDAV
jgi:hypothetical protein